jgi:restriction endonuclease S subunit
MTEFLAQLSKGSANQANISNKDIISLAIDLVSVAQQSHIVDSKC